MSRHALIAGATGLVGACLLDRLLADARYARVSALVRRPGGRTHPRLVEIVTDYSGLGAPPPPLAEALAADDVYCALGTTIRKAGSPAAFEAVDHGLVLRLACAAREAGASRFLLVSAIGADARSAVFYNRVKGRIELDLRALGYPALHLFRPSLLLGARAESRPAEALAQRAAPLLSALIPRAFERYAPIAADTVAAAMVAAAFDGRSGVQVHQAPFAV